MLVAENNQFRRNPHEDVKKQYVTTEEEQKHGSKLNAQKDKRNLEMVHGMVKVYLRSEGKNKEDEELPITIPDPFQYECKQIISANNGKIAAKKSVSCMVHGDVHRKFWLPLSEKLVKPQTKNGRLSISSGLSFAAKENSLTTPIDLMLVSDFSKSMLWEVGQKEKDERGYELPQGQYPNRKIDILRDVVKDISEMLLPQKVTENVSPYNRMGFTTFAAGARQESNREKCVLPYYLNEGKKRLFVKKVILDRNDSAHYFQYIYRDIMPNPDDCPTSYYVGTNNICQIEIEPKKLLKKALEIGDWNTINRIFDSYLDIRKTLSDINNFDGRNRYYEFQFIDERFCLGDNRGKATTQAWFDKNKSDIYSALKDITPKGGTAVTSGLIIGANIMMDNNKMPNAQPDKLQTNTQRIILVLSDGTDNQPSQNTLVRLINAGLCEQIKGKIDSLQDRNYHKLSTRIAFVAFGYNPPEEQVTAWKKCVGSYYYEAKNKRELLDSFKQIISLDEEVGHSVSPRKNN